MTGKNCFPGIPGARWEPLSSVCRALVTREHSFTTDTLLLADFSLPRRGEVCADLGTGCGAIPLLWRERAQPQKIYAVEIQEEAARLARTAVEANGFSDRIEVILGDAGNPKALFRNQSLDLVACNPPYQAAGTGPQGAEESRSTARHELRFSLEQLAGTARFALRFGGRLCLCLRPERLAEALSLFRSFGLEPKRLRLVQQRKDRPPSLFLLECRSGGKTGLAVEPVLLLEQDGGGYSEALEKIYGDYRANAGWKNRS